MDSHLRDFTRINRLMFFRSRSDKDPKDFLNVVYKILYVLGVTSIEKAELAAYQIKDVSQTWFVQWRDNRELRGCLVT